MGYMNEFPHSRAWDSDLRQILEIYESVKKLPKEFEDFKNSMIKHLEKTVYEYLGLHIEDILNKYLYDVTYNEATETISYIKREEKN